MNTEIVRRLSESFLARKEPTTIVAEALLSSLDGNIIDAMVEIIEREQANDLLAESLREDELIERVNGEGSK